MTEFMFANTDSSIVSDNVQTSIVEASWKVLIVDDEEDIHKVTKLVLTDFTFDGKRIEFIHAYTGLEAFEILSTQSDIALALVDVVMESEHSGLELVKRIRDELNNKTIRLVLRTGQPGQAPEKSVISQYDINDYKNKTELTDTKMHTLMYSSLRSYRDIITLENSRKGLEEVIKSSATIFELNNLSHFAAAVLYQLTSLLGTSNNAAHFKVLSGVALEQDADQFKVRAGIGKFELVSGKILPKEMEVEIEDALSQALTNKSTIYFDDSIVAYFGRERFSTNLLYLQGIKNLTETDKHLIDLFCTNVSIAFDNASLQNEIEETQAEVIYLLGESVENRSNETGFHVKRVAQMVHVIALAYGLSLEEADIMRMASPLHDLGKIAISDAILHKPGRHTDEERLIMQQHVELGYNMLKNSNRPVLKCAADIAAEHHEKWDGTGYPKGLKGEQISLAGRISAAIDVFDALINSRCYKPAWKLDDVLSLFNEESGKHFEPKIVDLIIENLDEIMEIQEKYQG